MARIRTVKPEYWTDERVGECSVSARLLFIACWNFSDDHGGLDRSAKQLKAQAFPYDAIDCEPLVQELLAAGLLIEYEVDGKKYLHISGFGKHQKVEKPAKPRIPLYDESLKTHRTLTEDSPNTHLGVAVSSSEGNGMEGKGSKRRGAASAPPLFDPSKIEGLDPEAWKLWLEHRTAIKKPIRPHSLGDAAEELAKLGVQQLPEVKRARAGGWQGLHPEKLVNGIAAKPGVKLRTADEIEAEERARGDWNAQH